MNENAKGSTMYERLGAVAELNKVPGFDPLRFARRVVQNGGDKLLLDLKYKKLWFRLRYPQGRIKVTPLKITEQLAIIEAKVFFDRGDNAPAASFIAQRYAKDTPGGLYIEAAQHMAADTALNDAGFGIQLMDVKDEPSAQVAPGQEAAAIELPIAVATPPIAVEPLAPAMQEQRLSRETANAAPIERAMPQEVAPTQTMNAAIEPAVEQSTEVVAAPEPEVPPIAEVAVVPQPPATVVESAPVEQPAAEELQPLPPAIELVSEATEVTAADEAISVDLTTGEVRYTADTPVDTICALMTLDEARNVIVDVGTCKGQTLAWVSERRAASLKWYLNGYQGDNNMLRAGARLLLENLARAS